MFRKYCLWEEINLNTIDENDKNDPFQYPSAFLFDFHVICQNSMPASEEQIGRSEKVKVE